MKTLKTLLFILICAAIYAGCNESLNINDDTGYGRNVSLTVVDFDVPADCDPNWSKMQHDSVYVINSEEEWAKIFTCESNPQIDFSTKTLLVAFGGTTNGIANISKELLFENNTCTLTVDITLDMTAVAQGWHIILITDKINTQSVVLNLNKHWDDFVEIEPVLIGKGELSGSEGFTKQNRVITSVEEWNELKTAMRDRVNTLTETDVDFSAYQVIAIFDEIHPSGGWSIDITGIVEYSDRIVVAISNLKTGNIASVLTQPYHIVKIAASDKKIVFQKEDSGYNGEPKEVAFTAYSLAGTSCQWTKINNNDEVVVINSNEEFNRYVTCTGNDYTAIDFSKYTLLLAHGLATSSVMSNCNSLQKFSEQNYRMNVDIVLGNLTVMSNWQTPIIINKLSEGCIIELIVTIKYE